MFGVLQKDFLYAGGIWGWGGRTPALLTRTYAYGLEDKNANFDITRSVYAFSLVCPS